MTTFADVPEQPEAKRLLEAALAERPAHAYLFHGPAGVGKHTAAQALAGALLGDPRRVDAGTHPDLRVIEPLGEMIRIDEIRALHHDLHMRPFEGDRRVYLIFDAHRMNDEAAAALLKDLEEPPSYATLVLVADELGSLPETIRSRCQLVPFRRLSRAAVEGWLAGGRRSSRPTRSARSRRVAGGRLDRAHGCSTRPPARPARRAPHVARSAYLDEAFDPRDAAARDRSGSRRCGRPRRASGSRGASTGWTSRRARRSSACGAPGFGAEQAELLASLDDLGAWYRDLLSSPRERRPRSCNADRLDDLREDVGAGAAPARRTPRALVRQAWREAEEFNLNPSLLLEALFVRCAARVRLSRRPSGATLGRPPT